MSLTLRNLNNLVAPAAAAPTAKPWLHYARQMGGVLIAAILSVVGRSA